MIRRTLRALRHRDYRLFYGGQAVSLVGTWMQQVAQSWLVYRLTGSASMLGVLAVTQNGPLLVAGPVAGVFADRHDKRRILVGTQILAALLALALGAITVAGVVRPWHIVILALLLGFVNAIDMPTRQAFIVEMVGLPDLTNAIALNSALVNGTRLIGPALAGLAIGVIGEGWCFILNGLSYVPVVFAFLVMTSAALPRRHGSRSVAGELREGLAYIRQTRSVAILLGLLGISSLAGIPYMVILPAFTARILHGDAKLLGLLMAAAGAGALLGALILAARRSTVGLEKMAVLGGGLFGLGLAALALAHTPLAAGLMIFIVGIGFMLQMAASNSLMQMVVPNHLRGRVMSIYMALFLGGMPIGGLVAGWLADRIGEPPVLALGGGLVLLASVALGRQLLRHWPAPAGTNPGLMN